MNYTTHNFTASDGEKLFYYHWKANDTSNVKGVIQIAHGIGEHAGRYQSIATILQNEGYEIYANDHRAHGKSVKTKVALGFYDGDNYFENAVDDMHQLSLVINTTHPKQKIILFGHSMGALLSRQYVTQYGNDLQALVLSGTGSYMKGLGFVGLTASTIVSSFMGRTANNNFLRDVFFGEFNKKFKPNRTKLDWISSDEKQVDIFEADPYRIEDFSLGIFIDVIKHSKYVNSTTVFKATPKKLPIYLFSGDKDPVGEMGKGIKKVHREFKKAGVKDITLHLYKGGRHEMLNEINKKEVEKDLIDWLDSI